MRRVALAAVLLLPAARAHAATVTVAAGGTLAAAVASATPGDTIHLPAGELYECAVLSVPGLTLEGEGDGTVLTDRTCEDKAILVVRGDGTTVRNLVLARARVPDRNGAGIRLEARDLVVNHVRFRDDEVGILAGEAATGAVRVHASTFEDGGVPAPRPTASVMAGGAALLQLDGCRFTGVKGNQVATAAGRTELTGNTIDLGPEPGAAVTADGGALVMEGNTIAIGATPPPRGAAVVAIAGDVTLRGNRLSNASGVPAVLLLDWTHGTPVLSGNQVAPGDAVSATSGVWRHRAGTFAHATLDGARHLAGAAKRAILRAFGR